MLPWPNLGRVKKNKVLSFYCLTEYLHRWHKLGDKAHMSSCGRWNRFPGYRSSGIYVLGDCKNRWKIWLKLKALVNVLSCSSWVVHRRTAELCYIFWTYINQPVLTQYIESGHEPDVGIEVSQEAGLEVIKSLFVESQWGQVSVSAALSWKQLESVSKNFPETIWSPLPPWLLRRLNGGGEAEHVYVCVKGFSFFFYCDLKAVLRKLRPPSVSTSTSGYNEHLKVGFETSRQHCVLNVSQEFPSWPLRNVTTLNHDMLSERGQTKWNGAIQHLRLY